MERKRPALGEALTIPGKADQHLDSTEAARAQYLARIGIPFHLRPIIAGLVFESPHGGAV